MPDPFPLTSFPGINQILSATFPLEVGVTASVCTIEMAPQDDFVASPPNNVQAYGTLTLFDGQTTLSFPDCRVECVVFDVSTNERHWRVSIVDRRWKWQGLGKVSGSFNERDGDNKLVGATEYTPMQLAQYCLDALLEIGYDLSGIPNDLRPTIHWDDTPPAQALAELCDLIGAVVVLQLDNTIAVVQSGSGADLPQTLDLQAGTQTVDFPAVPSNIVVAGAPIRYQVDFPLRAVGWEKDGSVVPINQLSYKPQLGWDNGDFGFWNNIADPALKGKAEQSVFRWYQLDPTRIPMIPGFGKITDLSQVLPLNTERAETVQEMGIGKTVIRCKPALVYGVFQGGDVPWGFDQTNVKFQPVGDESVNPDKQYVYANSFTINAELGIVQFGGRVFKRIQNQNQIGLVARAADLILRVAVGVRDAQSRAWTRYERLRSENASWITPTRYVVRDDIQRRVIPTYVQKPARDGLWQVQSIDDNQTDCDKQADYYITAAEQDYNRPQPATALYDGLKAIELDGAITQVVWTIGVSGCTTRASRNMTIVTPDTVPYAQRRFFEQAAMDVQMSIRTRVKTAKESPRLQPPQGLLGQNPPPPGHSSVSYE